MQMPMLKHVHSGQSTVRTKAAWSWFRRAGLVGIVVSTMVLMSVSVTAQTANTGALTGTVADSTGAVVPGVTVTATNEATGDTRHTATGAEGRYLIPLLPPGSYNLSVVKTGFQGQSHSGIKVVVTETSRVNVRLTVGAVQQEVTVESEAELAQTESAALGRVVDEKTVSNLPLVTRNYTQIIGLSPGVAVDVTNAAELGRGNGGTNFSPSSSAWYGASGFDVDGARFYDNNFQMNGVPINDVFSIGANSAGIAIPNPDTIQEFKVQTGQYDATYGRNGGANVDLVTKGGTNNYHGTLFEYFRNDALNANDYFFKQTHQPRPVLRQNQFGFTFGGPIKKDKLRFFGSYQGSRQTNGFASTCEASSVLPPLTDNRSAAAIGAIFAGQRGFFQNALGGVGPAVAADGSNINPVALALLQFKLPDGQYLIPSPQNPNGLSTFSIPCNFSENQFMTNVDYNYSPKSTLSARFFADNGKTTQTFSASALPGFPSNIVDSFRNFSLTHTHVFNSRLLNEAQLGFHRTNGNVVQNSPFTFSGIGATVPSPENALPAITVYGAFNFGVSFPEQLIQNTFTGQDSLVYTRGRNTFHFGGNISRFQGNETGFASPAGIFFLSFPDFLLGMNGVQNGTGFSSIYQSADTPGLTNREIRTTNASLYAQDDIKLARTLTVNIGVRYERISQYADALGRNAGFNISLADPNPPATGSINGYVVASNFSGTPPPGVVKGPNEFATNGLGLNKFAPRIGFAWQVLPKSTRFVLRGGYGMYYSPLVGQQFSQNWFVPPFAEGRAPELVANAAATFQQPIAPLPTFPVFPAYSPFTALTTSTLDPNIQPGVLQEYSLGVQSEITHDFLLEVGYVGSRGTHLIRALSLNQALLASPSQPIRGITTNTIANIPERVPVEGFSPQGIVDVQSEGASWYNALQASLTKRFNHGLQFLASYTFARSMDTDSGDVALSSGGNNLVFGNQTQPNLNYGPSALVRPQRFVVNFMYDIPGPKERGGVLKAVAAGWTISGVTTIQSGHPMFLAYPSPFNAYGISLDRPQFAPGCGAAQAVTPGSVYSKLNDYFNTKCFSTPPVIGSDGIATGFGDGCNGCVSGPGQKDTDLAVIKHISTAWPNEAANIEFRAEFFNAFNWTNFFDPFPGVGLGGFGVISKTSVNPRIIQFALKWNF